MDFIVNTLTTFMNDLGIFNMILALIFVVCGILLVILARRITRIVKGKNDIENNDGIMIFLKVIGILLMFTSLFIVVFRTLLS